MADSETNEHRDFIRQIVAEEVAAGKFGGEVRTRFPPEPNGWLHIGHAKAICIDFGIAEEFGGRCHLRFDDTNPEKEEQAFIDAIKADIRWLGFDWGEHEFYASDYFDRLYEWAVELIRMGKAYVDDQTANEIRSTRGTLTEPGTESPWRDRPVEESLELFARMKAGEFPNGARVLRAKIDMAAPNFHLRDPVLYRIQHAHHHRTGGAWCIYPMYDWAHGQSDSIEGITHSLCSLEFEDHRPLYDWCLDTLGVHHPRQIEFARLNLSHTIMQKRKLALLVSEGHVSGWDDPRLPTLSGMRRRGYPPEAIRAFVEGVGVAKRENLVELARLEHAVRDELNRVAPRAMAVLNPLRAVIENYPEERVEELDYVVNPEDESEGVRKVPFSREIFVEATDFMEDPPRRFHRLAPGREVRLRWGYLVTCRDVVKDENGHVVELRLTYDEASRGGNPPDGRKVRGTIHWVSARHAVDAEVRLYDTLFTNPDPRDAPDGDFRSNLNPESLAVVTGAKVEPWLAGVEAGTTVQFERTGYFAADPDGTPERPVFNRTVTLRDSWAKMKAR